MARNAGMHSAVSRQRNTAALLLRFSAALVTFLGLAAAAAACTCRLVVIIIIIVVIALARTAVLLQLRVADGVEVRRWHHQQPDPPPSPP